MKISLDWLAEYVSWEDAPEGLAAKLTSAGLNVESLEEFRMTFPGVVVAHVLHREKHPDADRLSLCRVDDGTGEPVQVVCGAPNVREGLTVLFARVGAVLPGDFKMNYGGGVFRDQATGLSHYGAYASMLVLIDERDPRGARVARIQPQLSWQQYAGESLSERSGQRRRRGPGS